MNISMEDVPQFCACCGDIHTPKTVLEINMNYRDGSSIIVTYGCEKCGKSTRATYMRKSQGPCCRKDGLRIRLNGSTQHPLPR